MRRIAERIRTLKLRDKMLLSHLLIALVPLIIYALVSGVIFTNQIYESVKNHTSQATAQVGNSLSVYIDSVNFLSNQVALMLQNKGALLLGPASAKWETLSQEMTRELQYISRTNTNIAGIGVAFADGRFLNSGVTRVTNTPFPEEAWYQKAAQSPNSFVLLPNSAGRSVVTDECPDGSHCFTLARAVTCPEGLVKAVVFFDIRHTVIDYSIEKVNYKSSLIVWPGSGTQSDGFVFVMDQEGNLVYVPERMDASYADIDGLLELAATDPNCDIRLHSEGEDYLIRMDKSDYTGWIAVGVFSLGEVMDGVYLILTVLSLFIIGVIILVVIIALYISSTITEPISTLLDLMHRAKQGELSVRFNSNRTDEIGDLGSGFNEMLDHVSQLIGQVYAEQRSKRDAELKILREQIKPHFLYNTLDTINWMARGYGADDIVALLDALTTMFRIGLSKGLDFISIREELTHISNYLYIQKVRYQDKLSYSIQVDQELCLYRIPKILLQPLVENSIYHGIKRKRDGGMIVISGKLHPSGDMLTMTVHDNGMGMKPQRAAELNNLLSRQLSPDEKIGFGVFYVAERIRLSYDNDSRYGIFFDSEEGVGTTVTLTLPAVLHHSGAAEICDHYH